MKNLTNGIGQRSDSVEKAHIISFDRSVPNQIFKYLRDEIVSMELHPGEMISESRLAMKFGVSRTPVREAILKLATIGLVEVRPQRGTFVSRLKMSKIIEACFVREALEVAVVNDLAHTRNVRVVVRCEEILRQQEAAVEAQDLRKFQELDDEFHQQMAMATGFEHTAFLVESEKSHMDRVRKLSTKADQSADLNMALSQHRAILAAVRTGDGQQAGTLMAQHINDAFDQLKLESVRHPEYFAEI